MLDLYKSTIIRIISYSLIYDWYAPFRSPFEEESVGTGFFIEKNGIILTCAHVVEDSMKLEITIPALGKKRYKAKVISLSRDYDMAIIQTEYKNKEYLEITNSDNIRQGDEVSAIGYSLGTDKVKLTKGIVSGYQNHLIQTDAAINPGNSGGPLLNKENKVVAVNSQKISSGVADNVGFSVPINLFVNLKDKFLNNENKSIPIIITKPLLLCSFAKVDKYINKYYNIEDNNGILITEIDKRSVLYKSGVRQYDVLIKFDGYVIDNFGEAKVSWNDEKFTIGDLLYRYPNNKSIKIEFLNKEKGKQEISVKLDYPKFNIDYEFLTIKNKKIDYEIISGLIFTKLTDNHLDSNQLMGASIEKEEKIKLLSFSEYENRFKNKIFLVSILPGSYVASNCDINAGSFLEEVNDKKVETLSDLRNELTNNKLKFIKLKFSNCKIVILDKDNIISEHKILSNRYMYDTSKFLSEYLGIYDINYSDDKKSMKKSENDKSLDKKYNKSEKSITKIIDNVFQIGSSNIKL